MLRFAPRAPHVCFPNPACRVRARCFVCKTQQCKRTQYDYVCVVGATQTKGKRTPSNRYYCGTFMVAFILDNATCGVVLILSLFVAVDSCFVQVCFARRNCFACMLAACASWLYVALVMQVRRPQRPVSHLPYPTCRDAAALGRPTQRSATGIPYPRCCRADLCLHVTFVHT